MLPKTICFYPEAIIDFCRQCTRGCSAIYMCMTLVHEIKVVLIHDKCVMHVTILKICQALST
jgi:hypothetical protein